MSPAEPTSRKDLPSVIGTLVAAMNNERSNATKGPRIARGEIAALRRGVATEPGGPAFWRTVIRFVEPHLYPDGNWTNQLEAQWIAILAILAELHALHRPDRRVGAAMQGAGVGELRLFKLLRSRSGELLTTVRATAHLVANRGQPSDLTEWARLLLFQEGDSDLTIRRSISATYYRAERTAQNQATGESK